MEYIVGGVLAVVVFWRIFGRDNDVIADQQEMAVRRADWKGTNGLAARRAEAVRVRVDWLGLWVFAGVLVVAAVASVVVKVGG